MKAAQRTVAIGALTGVSSMIALVALLGSVIPAPDDVSTLQERITYALQWNVVAVLPFFVMVISVANSRFMSEAIDPLAQRETLSQRIDGRVTDNTLQQNFVFLIGTLALGALLAPEHLQLLPALTIVFMLARLAFWFGYRRDPLLRAPGMAATAYLNLGVLICALWLGFF